MGFLPGSLVAAPVCRLSKWLTPCNTPQGLKSVIDSLNNDTNVALVDVSIWGCQPKYIYGHCHDSAMAFHFAGKCA